MSKHDGFVCKQTPVATHFGLLSSQTGATREGGHHSQNERVACNSGSFRIPDVTEQRRRNNDQTWTLTQLISVIASVIQLITRQSHLLYSGSNWQRKDPLGWSSLHFISGAQPVMVFDGICGDWGSFMRFEDNISKTQVTVPHLVFYMLSFRLMILMLKIMHHSYGSATSQVQCKHLLVGHLLTETAPHTSHDMSKALDAPRITQYSPRVSQTWKDSHHGLYPLPTRKVHDPSGEPDGCYHRRSKSGRNSWTK